VLVATIDRLCFHPAKIEMIKRWRGSGRHCPSFDETRLCNLLTKMSALGQKATFSPQQAMSALQPTATAKADIGKPLSALPLKADVCSAVGHVGFGPEADKIRQDPVSILLRGALAKLRQIPR